MTQRTPDAGKTMTDREMLELAAKAAAEAGRAMRDAMHTAITDQDMKGVCDEVAKK